MKRSLLLLLLLLLSGLHPSFAQALKKYAVGKSGCTAMFYCDPGVFEESTSPDSSVVYTGECTTGDVTYDLICVRLAATAPTLDVASQVLEQYLDFLKSSYDISATAGYKKDLRLKKNEQTRGMRDIWTDKDNNKLMVTGWTNGRYVAVLIAITPKELPESKLAAFTDGITFPAAAAVKPKPKPVK